MKCIIHLERQRLSFCMSSSTVKRKPGVLIYKVNKAMYCKWMQCQYHIMKSL